MISPGTGYSRNAWYVIPSGVVDNDYYSYETVKDSYGKDEAALMHQILINIGG